MKKYHPFTLVEIILALGVCVIGICSIMVLFPIGANANRDAAMETYAANAADQILHYLKYQITDKQDNWDTNITSATARIPDSQPTDPIDLELLKPEAWGVLSNDLGNNIFFCKSTAGIYQIINDPSDPPKVENPVDSRIVVYLWREEVMSGVTYDDAVRLLLEATWPAELDYDLRQKSFFILEVFKPKFD